VPGGRGRHRVKGARPRPAIIACTIARSPAPVRARREMLRNRPAGCAGPVLAQDVVVAGCSTVAIAVIDTFVARGMAVVGVTADIAAVARHLLRARVATWQTGVSAEQRAAPALANAHSDETGRTVAIRAAVAIYAAVATTPAQVGPTARSRGPTGTRDPSFAVRIAETVVVRAPRIVEWRSGRVLAAAVHSGVALRIHVAGAALAHAGKNIGAGVGVRARAGGQRRDGPPRARAGGTRWPMILGNAPGEQARADRPRHTPCGGSVRGVRGVRGPRHPRHGTGFLLDGPVGDP
jgi:hypothetical protein